MSTSIINKVKCTKELIHKTITVIHLRIKQEIYEIYKEKCKILLKDTQEALNKSRNISCSMCVCVLGHFSCV